MSNKKKLNPLPQEFKEHQQSIMEQIRAKGCDYPKPSVYSTRDGGYTCRCLICGRCGKHTGNSTQGHFWKFCDVTKTVRDFHLCCPNDCELENGKDNV